MRLFSEAKPFVPLKTLHAIFVLTILACCAGPLSLNRADPDLWGHVQFGRDVLDDGAIASTTSYSYTASGYRWINHENLAEIGFAILERAGGATSLLLFKFLLGLSILALIYRTMQRQGVGLIAQTSVLFLVSFNLLYHWTMRPQLATYGCYALMLAILHWCFQGWQGRCHFRKSPQDLSYSSRRLRCLWALPVVMFVWANSHGGFVAGYAVLFAYLAGRSLEAFWIRRGESWGLQRRLIMMATVAGLATLVNPYGPRLHLWLLESLGRPRPEIMEWLPPTLADPMSLPYWLLLAFGSLTLIISKRSLDATHVLLLVATGWQAFLHQRPAAFFAITCGFYLGPHFDSLVRRFNIESWCTQLLQRRPTVRGAATIVLLSVLAIQTFRISSRLQEMPVHYDRFPCDALQFIADHNMHGNLVVPYGWSQYVIASFGVADRPVPVKVAFDGRYRTCYPQALVDTYFDFAFGKDGPLARYRDPESPTYDPARILNYSPPGEFPPDMVMVDVRQPHGLEVLNSVTDDWMPVYADGMSELWARRSVFDQPGNGRYIPPAVRVDLDQPLAGDRPWPALPEFGRTDSTIRSVSLESRSLPGKSHSLPGKGRGDASHE